MTTGIEVLEKSAQEANVWLDEIRTGSTRAIGADHALHLAAQLPLLRRRPHRAPRRLH